MDLAMISTAEECNVKLGFNQTCYDRYSGKVDSCRICGTCQPGYWR